MAYAYDNVLYHLTMLRDALRTQGFADAIAAVVKPGDRVLDFGCGTGILSIFAERAGASQVFAVDRSPLLRATERIFADNGCSRITTFAGHGDDINLPSEVDVIVSEWMGDFLFMEPMLGPLLRVRERYLAPGGRMLPSECSLHAGLLIDGPTGEREVLTFLRHKPYGIDFSAIVDWPLYEAQSIAADSKQMLAETSCLTNLDMLQVKAMPNELTGQIMPTKDATALAIVGWFDAVLSKDVSLSTGPFAPKTHWNQLMFPLAKPLDIRAGEPATISLQLMQMKERLGFAWQLATAGRSVSGDNFIHHAWLQGTQA